MEYDCLRFSEIPHTTRLFASFTEDFPSIKEFYAHAPDDAGARAGADEARLDAGVRSAVAEILRDQNRNFGSDGATEKNIERLKNGAAAIVTGQQVSLFGGPAYSLYKALDAIRGASELTRAAVDAVPIFWLATEDHDLTEANECYFGERYGVARMEVPLAEGVEGQSVGRILLGDSAGAVVEHALELLSGPGKKEIADAMRESYAARETFGSAFGKLFARLLKGSGLILLDPLDRRLHELARPMYRKAIEDAGRITEDLIARGKLLEKSGFHAQVKVTPQSTLLFLEVDGKREALQRKNGDFLAGEAKLDQNELLERMDKTPEALSASVLLRPVLQDSILPTAAYIGGPAEVAYMAQAQVVYKRVLGRMPAILPRASFTLIAPEVARTLKKYELGFFDLLEGRQKLRRKMEARYLPAGLKAKFGRDEKTLRKMLAAYGKPFERLDKTLGGARDTAERKMLHQFAKLREKAGRAENARTGVLDRHEAEIMSALYPRHGLQERTLSLLPFLARHGMDLLKQLQAAASTACSGHRVLEL